MPNPFVYAIQQDGKLLWYRHDGQAEGTSNWQGPKTVGHGWSSFSKVFSGGDGVIYAIQEESRDPRTGQRTGGLQWYRHDGRTDGTFNWQGPKTVGHGWSSFYEVFSGGDGVIYAIQEESRDPRTGQRTGGLQWYRHDGRTDGTSNWQGPKTVGHGWSSFSKVFSGGDGVIYAIRDNGDLLWYRHTGRGDGSFRWAEGSGKRVGTGWNSFSTVYSGGDGVIYAIEEASRDPRTGQRTGGRLQWYRHDGRSDGTSNWQGPKTVGTGWNDFAAVFSGGANLGVVEALGGSFCGVPDQGGGIGPLTSGSPGFALWTRGDLKVSINPAGVNPPTLNAVAAITGAFFDWQNPPPPFPPSFFNFTFVQPGTGEDIRVIFGGSSLNMRFGSPDGLRATAGYPGTNQQGELWFDSGEVWTRDRLLSTALHEIGHLLGLSHSNAPGATMNPFVNTALTIDAESRNAIAAMYGWQPQQRASDGGTSHRASLGVTGVTTFAGTTQTPRMVWKGVGDDSGIYSSEFRGGQWSPQQRVNGVGCSHSPALTQIVIPGPAPATGLLMAWKGVGDDQSIYWARDMGAGWEGQRNVPGVGTSAGPALANVNGQIYMAWKGAEDDGGIYWSRYDGAEGWSAPDNAPNVGPQDNVWGVGTSDSPALVAFNGMLYMFWKGVSGDSNAYYSFYDFANDPIWKPQKRIEYFSYETGGGVPHAIGTSGALSAAVRGNSILLTWKGVEDDSAIYYSLFVNNEFSGQATVPNVGTSVGPSVVQADGRTFMAWKGIDGDTGIYWSRL